MIQGRRTPSRSLVDHHGEWCPLCLEYFLPREAIQLHHVIKKAQIHERFGSDLDFGWVVATHDDCHRVLQPLADTAATYFIHRLDGAKTIDEREHICQWFHEKGYYWLSVLANLDTVQRPLEGMDVEHRWRRREFALSSAAGIRGGQNVPALILGGEKPKERPRLELNLSNLRSARGHGNVARKSFELAKDIVNAQSKTQKAALLPGLLRRWAQISRVPEDASKAVVAAESEYSLNTAFVFQGILSVGERRFDLVEKSIEQLGERESKMSWLYYAELQFLRALYSILTDDKDILKIYSALSVAHYVYVILGLQMSISPKLPFENPSGRSHEWTPADVLCTPNLLPRLRVLDGQACRSIRIAAIGKAFLLEKLLDPICWDGPKPQPGHLKYARLREGVGQ